jgi:S1-C subfamily serine protease
MQLIVQDQSFCQQSTGVSEVAKRESDSVVTITLRDKSGAFLQSGSGFIVRSNGVVITNFHVIDGAFEASIKTFNGDIYDAVFVVDTDKRKDLAILRIKALNLPVVMLGDSDKIEVGEHVIAIGTPLGFLTQSVSDGIVSAVRQFEGYKMIQTTAPVSPGSSGGPLLNDQGEAIGVTAGQFVGQNLNLAVPINYVKPLILALDVNQQKTLADFNAGSLKTAPPKGATHAPSSATPAQSNVQYEYHSTEELRGLKHVYLYIQGNPVAQGEIETILKENGVGVVQDKSQAEFLLQYVEQQVAEGKRLLTTVAGRALRWKAPATFLVLWQYRLQYTSRSVNERGVAKDFADAFVKAYRQANR